MKPIVFNIECTLGGMDNVLDVISVIQKSHPHAIINVKVTI